MTERHIDVNGVPLCVDTVGDPGAPPILFIYGMGGSMDWWHPEFCARLAASPPAGRYVIRYDHRDTGRSASYPPGRPGYTGADLVADAVGLIDRLAGGRAHVAGLSMGSGIAQEIALEHPDRVATLTLMSTSPVTGGGRLPPPADRLAAEFADPTPEPDWTDDEAVVDYMVAIERLYAGPDHFDEAVVRETARRIVGRTVTMESSLKNHELLAGDSSTAKPLSEMRAPTLVIHGTEDPLLPPDHGRATARLIPGARLLLLDGVGHQAPPRATWDQVIAAIADHTNHQAGGGK